jgi:hypothetical protein
MHQQQHQQQYQQQHHQQLTQTNVCNAMAIVQSPVTACAEAFKPHSTQSSGGNPVNDSCGSGSPLSKEDPWSRHPWLVWQPLRHVVEGRCQVGQAPITREQHLIGGVAAAADGRRKRLSRQIHIRSRGPVPTSQQSLGCAQIAGRHVSWFSRRHGAFKDLEGKAPGKGPPPRRLSSPGINRG